jgi:hypothetical protein
MNLARSALRARMRNISRAQVLGPPVLHFRPRALTAGLTQFVISDHLTVFRCTGRLLRADYQAHLKASQKRS